MGNCCHVPHVIQELTLPVEDIDEAVAQELPESRNGRKLRSDVTLILKVVSSDAMEVGASFRITSNGWRGSLRGQKDGITYFGYKKREYPGKKIEIINDIVLKTNDQSLKETYRGRHFKIAYNPASSSYTIQDLGQGFGVFMRIASPIPLQGNPLLINMGESSLVIHPDHDISIKIYDKSTGSPHEFTYSSSEYALPNLIHIGRIADYEVVITDDLVSRTHAYIWYEHGKWVLADGEPTGQRSTNGCWLYLAESREFHSGMMVRTGQTVLLGEIE